MALFSNKKSNEKKSESALTPWCTAIIAAGGSSERMGGEDKLFYKLRGVPIIARTLQAFDAALRVDEIIVVTKEERIIEIGELCREYGIGKVTKIVIGGATRTESVMKGIEMLSDKTRLVAIHDGARPLVTEELINRVIGQAEHFNAAVPYTPLKDTVKERNGNFVAKTPERDGLVAVQTPQVFKRELLSAALDNAEKKGLKLTDDASAVEALGGMVHLTEGSEENIKLTTPLDMFFADAILTRREVR